MEHGVAIEPNSGSCLSRAALSRVGAFVQVALDVHRAGGDINDPKLRAGWDRFPMWAAPGCQLFNLGPKAQSGYQSIMTACFRGAGVYATDPRNAVDLRGRLYYPNVALDRLVEELRPRAPPPHCSWHADLGADLSWIFKGLEFLYLPCQCEAQASPWEPRACNDRWVAEYPIQHN